MEQQPVFDALVDLLAKHFQLDRQRLTGEATFAELEMDSLALMELVAVAENELGLAPADGGHDLDATSTLAEAATLMEWPVAKT